MDQPHPLIALFQQRAQLLDAQGNTESLDDGIAQLAGWLELAKNTLSEDDVAVLGHIGAVLYRYGLQQRIGNESQKRCT